MIISVCINITGVFDALGIRSLGRAGAKAMCFRMQEVRSHRGKPSQHFTRLFSHFLHAKFLRGRINIILHLRQTARYALWTRHGACLLLWKFRGLCGLYCSISHTHLVSQQPAAQCFGSLQAKGEPCWSCCVQNAHCGQCGECNCVQVRRLMEDDNSKKRKAVRRHYNETVRELAAFVRKRDKRVLAHMVCLHPMPAPFHRSICRLDHSGTAGKLIHLPRSSVVIKLFSFPYWYKQQMLRMTSNVCVGV